MTKMKRGSLILIFLVVFVLIISSIVNAGIFDAFKKITGRAISRPTNLSITVTGINPAVITYVSPIANTDPTESSTIAITFNVYMKDSDGVADLNDTSVSANFTKTGEATRQNLSCLLVNDIDTTSANYTCTIDMWYWDVNGNWNITVRGKDIGNATWAYNTSTIYQYNLLKAMKISPNSLTWGAVQPAAVNQTSNNHPTTINNTGNYNSTITVTAINLIGEGDNTKAIFAGNFSAGLSTGSNAECAAATSITLQNGTAITITGSVANRGNLSLGSGSAQEEFYYCVREIGSIPSQTYSTAAGGSWTISY